MKKITLAQAKKDCGITPKDLKGMAYNDIIRTVNGNAEALLEQGFITASQKQKLIDYGRNQANKGSY